MREVTDKLVDDGVKIFSDAFDKLLDAIQRGIPHVIQENRQSSSIVGAQDEPSSRLQHPSHLIDRLSRVTQPGQDTQGRDNREAGVREMEPVRVAHSDTHRLANMSLFGGAPGLDDHGGHRINRVHGHTTLGERDRK